LAGAHAIKIAMKKKIKIVFIILIELDITKSSFESPLKIRHFYLKEKK